MIFPNFPDFEKIWADNQKRGMAARMSADDGVKPEVGGIYTVSPCFVHGDRSWTDDFWQVLERSGPNLLVKIHENHGRQTVMLFREDERAWYPADAAFAVWREMQGKSA